MSIRGIPNGFARALLLMPVAALALGSPAHAKSGGAGCSWTENACSIAPPLHCSVFTIAKGGQVFFGGNDDFDQLDSYYWVDPGGADRYGVIWIGEPDNVQQGINEKGLAYDANGLPRVDVNPHTERTPVSGSYTSYPIHIMHECATVAEVIEWIGSHRWHSFMHDQLHFADPTGDAVIISAGPDGEVALTRKPPGDGFLVSTNFNVARPDNGFGYPCWRYDRAQGLLRELVDRAGDLSVEDAANVLDAIHQEGSGGWTRSSLVADLINRVIYLYYFYQFDRPVVLRVDEELVHPRAAGPLSELFPDDVRGEAIRRYEHLQAQAGRCRWAGMIWLAMVLMSLIVLAVPAVKRGQNLQFWASAVILLGPLALLVRLITGGRAQQGTGRRVLLEVLGDVVPMVVAFVLFLALIIAVPAIQSARLLSLLLYIVLPPLVGWLGFHSPLLSRGAGNVWLRRMPQALVTANLGTGGICIIAVPLINYSLRVCPILPLNIWSIVTWWVIAALGSLIGGLLLSLFEGWAVRCGYRAWSVLALGAGEVRTPSWRKLWWWIFLSYALLLAGFAAGALLGQVLVGR